MAFLIFIIAIIILFLGFKLVDKSNPVRYFVIIWIFQILLGIAFCSKLRLVYWGLGYIEVALLCSIMGSLFMQFYQPINKQKPRMQINSKVAIRILLVLLILAFIQPLQAIKEQGGLAIFFNINDLLEANNNISKERYDGGTEKGIVGSILLAITYTAPLYGGYVYRNLNSKGRILSILCVFPGIFIALTQAVKMALITSVILWIGGFMTYMTHNRIAFPKISFKFLIRTISVLSLFVGILFFSMILRTGTINEDIIVTIQKKFILYSIGHLPTFDQWFNELNTPTYTCGGTMFAGIANYLGIIERKQGIFQETYQIWNDNSSATTNIFTMFRVAIEDFGYIGSLLFFFVFGAFTTLINKNIRIEGSSILWQVIMMGIWAFILWSFVTSFFAYTSYIVMLILMYILLLFSTSRDPGLSHNTTVRKR